MTFQKLANPLFSFSNMILTLCSNLILFASRCMILTSKQRSCALTVICHFSIIVSGIMIFIVCANRYFSLPYVLFCHQCIISVYCFRNHDYYSMCKYDTFRFQIYDFVINVSFRLYCIRNDDFVKNVSFRYILYPK